MPNLTAYDNKAQQTGNLGRGVFCTESLCWEVEGALIKKSVQAKMLHVFGGLKGLLPGTSGRREKPSTEGIVASLHYKV